MALYFLYFNGALHHKPLLILSLFHWALSNRVLWLMTTQALMKACKSKGTQRGISKDQEWVVVLELEKKKKEPIFHQCLTCSYSLASLNLLLSGCLFSLESIMSPSSSSQSKTNTSAVATLSRGKRTVWHELFVLHKVYLSQPFCHFLHFKRK